MTRNFLFVPFSALRIDQPQPYDQLQSFHTGHHFIATVRWVAAAGVHHVFPIQRVTVGIDQLVRLEILQRFAAQLSKVRRNNIKTHGFFVP